MRIPRDGIRQETDGQRLAHEMHESLEAEQRAKEKLVVDSPCATILQTEIVLGPDGNLTSTLEEWLLAEERANQAFAAYERYCDQQDGRHP